MKLIIWSNEKLNNIFVHLSSGYWTLRERFKYLNTELSYLQYFDNTEEIIEKLYSKWSLIWTVDFLSNDELVELSLDLMNLSIKEWIN